MIFQDFFFSKIFAVLAESVIKFPLDFILVGHPHVFFIYYSGSGVIIYMYMQCTKVLYVHELLTRQ